MSIVHWKILNAFSEGFEIVNLDTKLCTMEEVRVSNKLPEP
jgi:hypothetical protein